jgi:hypothetical protein
LKQNSKYSSYRDATLEDPAEFLNNAKVLFSNLLGMAHDHSIFAEKFVQKNESWDEI